jgi:hypothetical protein
MVFISDRLGSFGPILSCSDPSTPVAADNRILINHRAAASDIAGLNTGTGYHPLASSTSWQVFSTLANGANSNARRNGSESVIGNAGTNNATAFAVGVDSLGSNYGKLDCAEVLIFPSALSANDRAVVENYLNNKWAIY